MKYTLQYSPLRISSYSVLRGVFGHSEESKRSPDFEKTKNDKLSKISSEIKRKIHKIKRDMDKHAKAKKSRTQSVSRMNPVAYKKGGSVWKSIYAYNHSENYVMAVLELAEEIRKRVN